MAERKAFITEDNTVRLVCPRCRKSETADVGQHKDTDRAVRIRFECTCGHAYDVLVERRRFYRKETRLPGIYIMGEHEKKAMTVRDLSLTGMKFEIDEKVELRLGDTLFVEFSLNDEGGTLVRKKVFVKKISDTLIGAEFCTVEPKSPSDDAIRAYVIP